MEHVVNMRAAKSQLSKLVALARQGESVMISIRGTPVVKLVPIKPQPVIGLMKGRWPQVPRSSFAAMSDKDSAEWGL